MKYGHGGDIYRSPVEYDFSVNINPLGMPEKSIAAAQEAILLSDRYPDWQGEELCRAISVAEGIKKEQVVPGNGAAELIYALCYAIRPGQGMVMAPSFQEYEAAIGSAGGKTGFWKLQEPKGFSLDETLLEALTEQTDLLFLCNPNNPTGTLTSKELLEKIAGKCERTDTYFCIDECFLPFLEQEEAFTMKRYLERFPHLIVLRAFTKVYGMPGLRLGYLLSANEGLREKLRLCLPPWNTSLPAQMAGIAALQDAEYLQRARKVIREEKAYLQEALSQGLAERIYASGANFIFFQSRPDLKERLLERRILIRSCSDYRNLGTGFFRIGVKRHQENQELIRRWREAL